MEVDLDLRRGLPRVRKAYSRLIKNMGECWYSAPCVVGAMMTPAQRRRIKATDNDGTPIDTLIRRGVVSAPSDQKKDLLRLQEAFDKADQDAFDGVLTRLERKYLAEQVSA